MRQLALVLALSVGLCGCTALTTGQVSSPSSITGKTVVDEQAGSAAELAYKTFRLSANAAVDSGCPWQKTGQCSVKTLQGIRDINTKLYTLLGSIRTAYTAVNATDYTTALSQFYASVAQGYAVLKGK